MKPDCEILKQFDEKYISSLVNRLLPLWNVPGESEDFNRRYVEMIIRTNMHINDMQFMMTEKTAGKTSISELKAIAFAAAKSDKSDGSWFFKFLEALPLANEISSKPVAATLTIWKKKLFL